MKTKRYRAFISDRAHVLYPEAFARDQKIEACRRFLSAAARRQGVPPPEPELFARAFNVLKAAEQGLPSYKAALRDLAQFFGVDANPPHSKDPQKIVPREGVVSTLREMRRRSIPFVILTDATRSGDDLMRSLKKISPVTAIVSSLDIGATKPSPHAFRAAIEAARVAIPSVRDCDIAFIGHDLDEILGARAFGLDTIVFCESPAEREVLSRAATHRITRFSDLLELC